jgi:hypothetical protein
VTRKEDVEIVRQALRRWYAENLDPAPIQALIRLLEMPVRGEGENAEVRPSDPDDAVSDITSSGDE